MSPCVGQGTQPTLPLGHPNPGCVLTLPLCRKSVQGQGMDSFSSLPFKRHHFCIWIPTFVPGFSLRFCSC